MPRSELIWGRQAKRIVNCMTRLFFSATFAFSVPFSFAPAASRKGLVVQVIPTVLGKLVSGMFFGNPKWLVGWAMVARGEHGFLVLQTAKNAAVHALDDDLKPGLNQ